MQTASGTLASAITSRERQPVVRLTADFGRDGSFGTFDPGVFREVYSDTYEAAGNLNDLTPFVVSASVDKSLSTDLPDAAKLDTGYGAAAGSVTLAGSLGGLPLTQVFTAYDNPLSNLAPRIGTSVRLEMGMRTSVGVETLRQLTGTVRNVSIDPDAGTVNLDLLDYRDKVRTPVSLPVAVGQTAATLMTAICTANGFTPSLETTLNNGIATPGTDTSDPWQLLQYLADAEQGVILFDEQGTLRFYNRNHMSGGSVVATITTDPSVAQPSLKSLASEETGDAVRNFITVPGSPYDLDAAGTIIWTLAEALEVPSMVTLYLQVDMPGTVYSLVGVAYNAQKNADGTGGAVNNLVFTVSKLSATQLQIAVTNINTFTAYVVNTSGDPDAKLSGQLLRPAVESGYLATRSDTGSASRYGTQSLEVAENPFRQSTAAVESLADYLIAALHEPHPTLSGVQIVGDPRLQLADRVRVTEPGGLALDGEFWLVGIQTTFSVSDGLSQSVTLRSA